MSEKMSKTDAGDEGCKKMGVDESNAFFSDKYIAAVKSVSSMLQDAGLPITRDNLYLMQLTAGNEQTIDYAAHWTLEYARIRTSTAFILQEIPPFRRRVYSLESSRKSNIQNLNY